MQPPLNVRFRRGVSFNNFCAHQRKKLLDLRLDLAHLDLQDIKLSLSLLAKFRYRKCTFFNEGVKRGVSVARIRSDGLGF